MSTQSCICCSAEKPLEDFYKHPQMANGRLGRCKECHKREIKRNRDENVDRVRAYDRFRAKTPERKAAYAAKNKRKRKEMGPEYDAAHNAVTRAIKSGVLIRPDHCSVCLVHGAPQAHHDDHSRKLDVMWLCPICHAARHVELKKARDAK